MRNVQTIHETRRSRLNLLLKTRSLAQLNDELQWPRTDSRLSRIKNNVTRTDREGKHFEMGDNMAREIEARLNLPHGWMDTPPTYAELTGQEDALGGLLMVMENLMPDQWPVATRLLKALGESAQHPSEPKKLDHQH